MKWFTKKSGFFQRGVSTVEFALCLPVFLMMICGFIDFCRYYFLTQALTHAAREGLRSGVIFNAADPANASLTRADVIRNTIRDSTVIPGGLAATTTDPGAKLTITPIDGGASLERVTLRLEADFRFITPFMASFAPTPQGVFPVKVTTSFRNEP